MASVRFTFINPTEGFHEEAADTDTLLIGKVTAAGIAGIAFDATGDKLVNLATPTDPTDAANKSYVDGLVNGLDWKNSVRLSTTAALAANTPAGSGIGKTLTADANGALSVDGVAVAVNDRILVKNEAAGADNGIYIVTDTGDGSNPFILTRATDADQSAEVTANLAAFVEEGTASADTGWVLTTNNPITLDTTALVFSQFTGVGSLSAGAGILKTGSQLDVELDTGADAQGTGNGGGGSGLEFDVSGVGGKLRAKVDPAGGIQRGASGLLLEIDDSPDTLDVGANGLKVVGLPSLFKINDVAVGANVTAANLDILVGGASSSADTLHRHGKLDAQFTADEAIVSARPVAYSIVTSGRVVLGDADTDAKARIVGISRTAAAAAGNTLEVVSAGPAAGVLVGASVGVPYFLASGGGLTTTPPSGGKRVIGMGYAINATDLFVRIMDYGKKI